MCGIFCLLKTCHSEIDFLSNSDKLEYIKKQFNKGQNRGPEYSTLNIINNNLLFGFHRLAINGLNDKSNQPIYYKGIYLICNGEIYNYKSIYKNLKITPNTDSDCESIIHLYLKYGIKYTLHNLDGVFSFILYDTNINNIFIARDPYGVRPLYYSIHPEFISFSSVLQQISSLHSEEENSKIVKNFNAGTFWKISLQKNGYYEDFKTFNYYNHIFSSENIVVFDNTNIFSPNFYFNNIYYYLYEAVKKRVITSDRNIACLLSGGLDSSLICSFVSQFVPSGQLKTFSIGMSGSEDLYYAKLVANHIHSDHHEIILDENDFFLAIPEVIKQISSYDTTTVRASVGNYLVSKYISENCDAKVIFNGDGSDEVTGGYLYFHNCPSNIEFDYECKRLLDDIQYFDVLRSDRTISCHGLEARTPFLDRTFVNYYLSIPSHVRNHNNYNKMEKYLLRESIFYVNPDLLPKNILFRTKEAFSDGVSSKDKSWFEIIQTKLENRYDDNTFYKLCEKYNHNKPTTKEQLYYREIFENNYQNLGNIIPYFWMPKYSNAKDASARTLDIYKNNNEIMYNNYDKYDTNDKYEVKNSKSQNSTTNLDIVESIVEKSCFG